MNETNCFDRLDSINPFKIAYISSTVICIICAVPAFSTVIWFEKYGSDKKRTVINKLISTICYIGIFANVFVQGAFVSRFAFGPLPPLACFWICLSKRICICAGLLIFDSISGIRFMFIFCLKNPAAFNDDFWHVFISSWCILMSFNFQILRATIPGSQLVDYNICTGEDPTTVFLLPSFGKGIAEGFSLVLQIYIYASILVYKRQKAKMIGPQDFKSHIRRIFIKNLDKQSLSSLATDIVAGIILAFGSVLVSVINFKSCNDFQSYPKFILVYHTYMLSPCIATLIAVIIIFLNNPSMKQAIIRELHS